MTILSTDFPRDREALKKDFVAHYAHVRSDYKYIESGISVAIIYGYIALEFDGETMCAMHVALREMFD